MRNFLKLNERCEAVGVAIMEVPADGNCMAWSLRTQFLGFKACHSRLPGTRQANQDMKHIRKLVGDAWSVAKRDQTWRTLFECFCAERVVDEPPVTPEKKKKPKEPMDTDVSTPPRPEIPRPKRLKRVLDAQPVPIGKKGDQAPLEMKKPNKRKRRLRAAYAEPDVPDLEDAYHLAAMAEIETKPFADLDTANIEEIDSSMLVESKTRLRKRKRHARQWKSRPKTKNEVKAEKMNKWLADKQLSYDRFLHLHRLRAVVKKASICADGSWGAFKTNLIKGCMPSCQVCLEIMNAYQITLESMQEWLENDLDQPYEPAEDPSKKDEAKVAADQKQARKSLSCVFLEDLVF